MDIVEVIEHITKKYDKRRQLIELYELAGNIEEARNYREIPQIDFEDYMEILEVYILNLEIELKYR